MSRSTISTFQLFQAFPDEEAARLYLESRWHFMAACGRLMGLMIMLYLEILFGTAFVLTTTFLIGRALWRLGSKR